MRGVIVAAALLVGGCAGTGIVPAGPDSYTLTKQIAPVAGSEAQVANEALTEVNAFCEQRRLQFAPIQMGPVPSGLNPPSMYTVTFRCVAGADAPAGDPHRYGELIPGTSTRDEAIAKLGPPQGTSNIGGNVQFQWIDYNPVHPFHVSILFAPDGRMIRVTEVLDQ